MPIEDEREMNRPIEELTAILADDSAYRDAFAIAFPDRPDISENTIAGALATYERTLVSPETRFDRWIEGDHSAMTEQEKRGFQLFNGKANCAACHSGWAFTDHAFHDIGLRGDDPGRGAILDLAAARHAFKTPTLRDIARRAPHMHDGSLPTLQAVLTHYETGIVERPTLSSDLQPIALTPEERADLITFLHTLTSENPIDVSPEIAATTTITTTRATSTNVVSQRDKAFLPPHIRLQAGDALRIANDDTRMHNVRIHDPALEFNSGAQEPGETITVKFDRPGRFYAFCGIHPKMELVVDVVGE